MRVRRPLLTDAQARRIIGLSGGLVGFGILAYVMAKTKTVGMGETAFGAMVGVFVWRMLRRPSDSADKAGVK